MRRVEHRRQILGCPSMQFFTFLSPKRKELHVFYGGIGVEASRAPGEPLYAADAAPGPQRAVLCNRRPRPRRGCVKWWVLLFQSPSGLPPEAKAEPSRHGGRLCGARRPRLMQSGGDAPDRARHYILVKGESLPLADAGLWKALEDARVSSNSRFRASAGSGFAPLSALQDLAGEQNVLIKKSISLTC